MSDICYIRCPECDSKFKSTTDKEGKKVHCPLCADTFKVTADMISLPKASKSPDAPKKAKPAADEKPAEVEPLALVPTGAPSANHDDEDEDENPYGMIQVKVAPRCPSCANELISAKDVICVHCGYNLLTREVGETKKLYALTSEEHWAHLAPALLALAFAFIELLSILYYCLVLPYHVADSWLSWWLDSEPTRLFYTTINMMLMYWAGNWGLQHVIFKPKPPEREK